MHAFWNKKEVEARNMKLSGKEHFEAFVDSKSKGDINAIAL
jgi:hypothetical protein